MKQNQGKTLYYEMRMPRKLLFQVSYFSHCLYMFDTDSSEGNLQNTYCIKMFENFFMCYSIFRIILFHIFRNAQHWSFCGLKDFWEFSLIWCAKSFLYYQEYLNHSIKFHMAFDTPGYFCVIFVQLTILNCPGINIWIMQNF